MAVAAVTGMHANKTQISRWLASLFTAAVTLAAPVTATHAGRELTQRLRLPARSGLSVSATKRHFDRMGRRATGLGSSRAAITPTTPAAPTRGETTRGTLFGTVKWFNSPHGFGFIIRDDGGPEVYVHHADIMMQGFQNLQGGQRVRFAIEDSPKGPQARKVQPLTRPVPEYWPSISPATWLGDR